VRSGNVDRTGRDHVEIPARPELELDAREALIDRALDLLHQDVERVLHAEVGADRDGIPLAAQRHVQGHAPVLGLQHPPGDLQRGPRELVALHEVDSVQQVLRRDEVLADQAGGQMLAHGVVGGQGVVGGVRGDERRAALAPGVVPLALHPHHDRIRVVLVGVRRAPHEGQRDPHPVDVDALDVHSARLPSPGDGVKLML